MQRNNHHWSAMAIAKPPLRGSAAGGGAETLGTGGIVRPGKSQTHQVYLTGSGLPDRWNTHAGPVFTVAEAGFGNGLAFLSTWEAWRKREQPTGGARRLHYIAIEPLPLHRDELARAAAAWPELAPLADALIRQYPHPLPGVHRVQLESGAVTVDFWWGNIAEVLIDLRQAAAPLVNAWYLKPLATTADGLRLPVGLGADIAALSQPGATVATGAVEARVKDELAAAGFTVTGGQTADDKLEPLLGQLNAMAANKARAPARWDLPWHDAQQPIHVLVLGAGLAGCHTAAALARRGVAVTLLESGSPAQAASGNAQGVLYTRLSHRHSALTDFALSSFGYAVRFYAQAFAQAQLREGEDGALCGSFHQVRDAAELERMQVLLEAVPELAQVVDAQRASQLIGLEQASGGYWYPQSGWLAPPAVCAFLLQQQGITLKQGCGAVQLHRQGPDWLALSANGSVLGKAPAVVIAAGIDCTAFDVLTWLPVRPIRGQTTQLPALPALQPLRAALCHQGYIAPAVNGEHCIGATFGPGDSDPSLRQEDQAYNLTQLGMALPSLTSALEAFDNSTLPGRTGWRCASPDYLPMVGPVPDRDEFLERFAALRDNARQPVSAMGAYHSGLYVNTGHGSRGLTSTPLAAELLASQICAEPLPVEPEILRALAPARFLLRDLGRNRI